jgi:tRNA(fMet)-specific endonuclease VapC
MNDEFDLLIRATAIKNNLILVTDNLKDFKNMEGIQIDNWMNR